MYNLSKGYWVMHGPPLVTDPFGLNTINYGRAKMYNLVSICLRKLIPQPDKQIYSVPGLSFASVCFDHCDFPLEAQYDNHHLIIIYQHTCSSYRQIPSSGA